MGGYPSPSVFPFKDAIPKQDNSKPCYISPLDKMHKLSFLVSQHKSEFFFLNLIYIDLWGLCNEITYDGSHYFLTIVNDFSRCNCVFVLTLKSEASNMLQSFCAMIATLFETKIKIIRIYNGGELDMKKFYLEKMDYISENLC